MNQETMRAVFISKPGDPEVLEIRDTPMLPAPTADRVLVRVHAAGINRADILQRRGNYPPPPGVVKDIPGMEFAGEVAAIGSEVRHWRLGQRVFGIVAGGAYAEFVTTPEGQLAPVPDNLDWVEAAAVPEAFITAHDAMFTRAGLKPGESVLIHAAGSGVGLAAVQLGRSVGALVMGSSRTADKLWRAREYGLDVALIAAGEPENFVRRILNVTAGRGVNVILDLVGGAYFEANIKAIAPAGRLVLISTSGGSKAEINLGAVMSKRLDIMGTVLRGRSAEEKATATRLFTEQIVPLLARGLVRPVVDRVFPLDQAADAHRLVESNESFGKVVLTL